MTRQRKDASIRWGLTAGAAWKGAGASVLLHLLAGAALIAVLSGPPKAPPQVIDITLLPPPGIAGLSHPAAIAAATEPAGPRGTPARPGSPSVPAPPSPPASPVDPAPPSPPAAANPPAGAGQAKPSPAAPPVGVPEPGSFHGSPAVTSGTDKGPPGPLAGIPRGTTGTGTAGGGIASDGTSGAGAAAGSYAWIRDAIQRASAYPPTARRMGWEGKVVVAFRLLPDGSVRNVRIVRGSGHPDLDRGAIDAVRSASPFPRTPGEAEIITPVLFHLTPSP